MGSLGRTRGTRVATAQNKTCEDLPLDERLDLVALEPPARCGYGDRRMQSTSYVLTLKTRSAVDLHRFFILTAGES